MDLSATITRTIPIVLVVYPQQPMTWETWKRQAKKANWGPIKSSQIKSNHTGENVPTKRNGPTIRFGLPVCFFVGIMTWSLTYLSIIACRVSLIHLATKNNTHCSASAVGYSYSSHSVIESRLAFRMNHLDSHSFGESAVKILPPTTNRAGGNCHQPFNRYVVESIGHCLCTLG